MAWLNDGVWVSIRLDTTLRLYHARTRQHLQYLDIEPFITRMLGTSNLGLSLVRISSLMIANKRLWIGTGNGVILSIPFSGESGGGKKLSSSSSALSGSVGRVSGSKSSDELDANVPYCNLADAQFSFHGHRDAIKFFLNVPSEVIQKLAGGKEPAKYEKADTVLVVSGGHGYIDFRIGDSAVSSSTHVNNSADIKTELVTNASTEANKNDQSRLIVWQINDQ